MSLGHGAKIVKDGLVFAYDMGSTRSYGKNAFQYSTDLYSWFNVGARCTLERDTIQSPVGNTPLKMTVTSDTDPYTNTYSGSQWIITEAVQGETWTASCWVRSSVPTTSAIWIFESNVNGAYTSISNPSYSINSEWQRITTTRTMTDATTASITIRFDGPDSLGNGVEIWYDGLQLERNSSASSFSKIYNPNQKEIVDWAGGNTITATSLTYNSDNTFSFNGSTNYATIGTDVVIKSGGGWTVESWFNLDVVSAGSLYNFIGSQTNSHNSWYWCVYQSKLAIWNKSPGLWLYGSSTISPSTWYQAVIVVADNGIDYQFYLNGEPEGGTHTSYAFNAAYSSLMVTNIGRSDAGSGRYFHGKIASTKMYNRALTANEVKNNFNAHRGRYGI